jgi:hypothetical protein
MIRVLGPEGAPQVVAVNQPTTARGPNGQPMRRVYDLGLGRYDLTVGAGPSYTTRRQDAAEQMMTFVRAFPGAAPVIGDLLAKNLDWPGSAEIARRLQALLPPGAAGPNPQVIAAQEQVQQLTAQLQQATQALAASQSTRQLDLARLQLETKRIEIEAFQAQTDRLAAARQAN